MAEKRLVAIIDETGTTNKPDQAPESDFGVAALVLPVGWIEKLRGVGIAIARVAGSDFKYKDVQKNAEARRLFLRGTEMLRREEGIYGFYAAGRSLLNERYRAYAAV